MSTDPERITALEVVVPLMDRKIDVLGEKMDKVIAYQERERGAAKVAAIIWGGLIGLGGMFVGYKAIGH